MKITGYRPPSPGKPSPNAPAPATQAPNLQGSAAPQPSPATPNGTPGVVWGSAGASYQSAYTPATSLAARTKDVTDPHRAPSVDQAPVLTRRLVAAKHPMGVRQVMGEVGSQLVKLRLTAALDPDGEEGQRARTQIRRLETLLRRAHHKIRGLDQEQQLRQREQRAEKQAEEDRARALQEARRKHQLLRQTREQRYLLELTQEELAGKGNLQKKPRQPGIATPGSSGLSFPGQPFPNIPGGMASGIPATPAAPDSPPPPPPSPEL